MMDCRYILFFIFSFACSSVLAVENLSVYRNDSTFNQIFFSDEITINHERGEEEMELKFVDWIKGETSVPLSQVDYCEMRQLDIPVFRFNFPDYPDVGMIWDKENYIDATLMITGNGFADDSDNLALQVKGRGNSTWLMPKKPIRMKFSKKTSICGLKKAKSFVLLNNYIDPTLMRNALAMWLAHKLEVPYANSIVPCHVFINDSYAGAYTLTEKVGINSGSVDIDEATGILFEISSDYDEPYKFKSEIWDLPVMVKDPDFDELFEGDPSGLLPQERLALWQEDFNNSENAVRNCLAHEAFDLESVAKYLLLNEIVLNEEIIIPKSIYLYKRSLDPEEKYFFGPAWDFDVAFNFQFGSSKDYYKRSPEESLWVSGFLDALMNDPEVHARMESLYKKFEAEFLPDFWEFFDYYSNLILPSTKLNGLRWTDKGDKYSGWVLLNTSFDSVTHISELREWLTLRFNFLHEKYTSDFYPDI